MLFHFPIWHFDFVYTYCSYIPSAYMYQARIESVGYLDAELYESHHQKTTKFNGIDSPTTALAKLFHRFECEDRIPASKCVLDTKYKHTSHNTNTCGRYKFEYIYNTDWNIYLHKFYLFLKDAHSHTHKQN